MRSWSATRRALLAAVVALGATATARAGVLVETHTRDPRRGGETTDGKLRIEGGHLRIDFAGEEGGGRPMSILFDGKADRLSVLDHRAKQVLEIDRDVMDRLGGEVREAQKQMRAKLEKMPPEQRAMVEQMMRSAGMGGPPPTPPALEVNDTGREEKVGARTCRVYELRRAGERTGEVCAVAWKEVGLARSDFEAFRDLGRFQERWVSTLGGRSAEAQPYEIIEEVDGFPLRSREFRDGKLVSETTFGRVERRTIPASEFEVPKGYRPRSMAPPSR